MIKYLGDALFADRPLTQPTVGASRPEEAKASLHAEEADLSLGHVLFDGEVEG